jgi:fatty-acyl-CoA synthase
MITSTMQDDFQLTTTAMLEHGAQVYPDSEVVTWTGGGARRSTFAEVAANANRFAAALVELGVQHGDAIGTFCWNSAEHVEAYYAVPGIGAVVHTLNIRLKAEQIVQIVEHAGDRMIVVDDSLLPLLAPLAAQLPSVEAYIVVGDAPQDQVSALEQHATVHRYADLLAAHEPTFVWPRIDEKSAAAMCYTSGTTGDPKGVVYSHRSTYLHALATLASGVTGFTESDRILTFVPMFHVNAWGIPFGAFLGGSTLHLPGRFMTPDQICEFIRTERSTVASAVPTIWGGILQYGREHDIDLSSLRMGTSGGAAIPRSLMEAFEQQYGLRIIQGWGMTETSPVAGMAWPPPEVSPGSPDEMQWRLKSGRVVPGVQMRIVSDDGDVLPWDGEAVGEIEVRGPWITGSYHAVDVPEKFDDGWLRTGDIGTIDHRGFFLITDRSKDVIKSGGEWISSVELENLLAASPDVAEAAVIGIPDEKWTERPLAAVVLRSGADASPEQLAHFLDGKVASWQIPENWTFVDEVPKTTVGKFDKKVLRTQYADGELKVERTR